jgi:hypothetical protein
MVNTYQENATHIKACTTPIYTHVLFYETYKVEKIKIQCRTIFCTFTNICIILFSIEEMANKTYVVVVTVLWEAI